MYRIFDVLKFLVVIVLVGVIIYLLYLLYLNWTHPDIDIYLFNTSPYTFESFLKNLEEQHLPPADQHERLYKVLRRLDEGHLGNLRKNAEIPYDYRYFFQEVVPTFLHHHDQPQTHTGQKGQILATFSQESAYVAKLLRVSGPDARILNGTRKVRGYPKRLEMTAAETSDFLYPAGLFVVDGKVLNPVIQNWNGLVILDDSGRLHIRHIDNLEYEFRQFRIKQSHQDYLDFLKLAERQDFSIFQSPLLINDGHIDVSQDNTKRFRRRVIFQDQYEAISIYDSFEKELTLDETAYILREQYGAMYAINLDMGPYGYCGRYENDQRVALYGGKGKHVQLSNILIFHYN